MKLFRKCLIYFYSVLLLLTFSNASFADLPTLDAIQAQLNTAKSADQNDPNNKVLQQNLEETLNFLNKIAKQKTDNATLKNMVSNAAAQASTVQKDIDKLKTAPALQIGDFNRLSLIELQNQLLSTQQRLQQTQTDLVSINAQLVSQRTAPEKVQSVLSTNLIRSQEIDKLLFDTTVDN
ncbi:mechanosensitive channel MscK, partial [Avibacterium paragallinarum]